MVRKVRSNRGVSRIIVILVLLILVMVVLIVLPHWEDLRELSQRLACEQALKSARDGLIVEYLSTYEEGSAQDAAQALDRIMPGRDGLCPAGGTVYLIRDDDGIFEPVCGLHARDGKLRTRLNASEGLSLLRDTLRQTRRKVDEEPDSVEITLNGSPVLCKRVTKEWKLPRGTSRTEDYEGVIVLYGLAGDGDFKSADEEAVSEGEICYYVYADERYCAVWHASGSWTGDSYD